MAAIGDMRAAVFARDGGCVALRIDPKAGPCRGWFEMDYIRFRAAGKRHELASDHVMLCHFHHQGAIRGYVWATAHRPQLREYLETCVSDTERPTI